MKAFDMHVSLDIVLFSLIDEKLCIYIQKRDQSPYENKSSLLHCSIDHKNDKTIEAAIYRVLSSLDINPLSYIEQVKTVGNSNRDPRGWSLVVVYYGFIAPLGLSINQHWTDINNIESMDLAFDHNQIVSDSLQRLKNKALYTSLPAFLLPNEFTLTELQRAYEIVLGFKIEKKSFRRRMLDANLLLETDNLRHANHRPAQLYNLAHKEPHIFNRIIEGERC